MRESVLALRYAKALFEVGKDRGILEKVVKECRSFQSLLLSNEDFRKFLLAPEIGRDEKKKACEDLFQDKFSGLFFNFIMLLLNKRRHTLFPEIADQVETLHRAHLNKISAEVVTTIPLDKATLSRLQKVLSGHFKADIDVDNRLDDAILGGLIVRIKSQVIDNSVRRQLELMKQDMLASLN